MRINLREQTLLGVLVLILGAGGWYALGIRPVRKRAAEWRMREERASLSLEAAALARHEVHDLEALENGIAMMESTLAALEGGKESPELPAEGECPVCRVAAELGLSILESASCWDAGGRSARAAVTRAPGAPHRSVAEPAPSATRAPENRLVFETSFQTLLRFAGRLRELRPPISLARIDVQVATEGAAGGTSLLRGEMTWRAVP